MDFHNCFTIADETKKPAIQSVTKPTGRWVVLLLLTCGLGFAHGYLLGDDTMLCWKSAHLTDCPPGSDLIWHVRPATQCIESEGFTAIYELNPGSLSNTRSGPNKMLIDHANLHGCRQSIGFWCAHRRPDQCAVRCIASALHGIPESTAAPRCSRCSTMGRCRWFPTRRPKRVRRTALCPTFPWRQATGSPAV